MKVRNVITSEQLAWRVEDFRRRNRPVLRIPLRRVDEALEGYRGVFIGAQAMAIAMGTAPVSIKDWTGEEP